MRVFGVDDRGNSVTSFRTARNRAWRRQCLLTTAAAGATFALSASLASAQTNNYFGTTGTLSSNAWSTTPGGNPPGTYDQAFNTTGGGSITFENTVSTLTGGSLTVTSINATADVATWGAAGTITGVGGVISLSVAPGRLLDTGTQIFATGTSFIKDGAGIATTNSTMASGAKFTLNEGVMVFRQSSTAGGAWTLNGGAFAVTANRSFTLTSLTIGGNVTFGQPALGTIIGSSTIGFTAPINLGAATRTFSTGNASTTTFTGVIAGDSGVGLNIGVATTLAGVFVFAGTTSNTYTGDTVVQGATLNLNKTAGQNAIAGNLMINGGTVGLLASNQINDTSTISVAGGTFALGAMNETISSIQLTSGNITSTTGVLASVAGYDVQNGSITAILGGGNVGLVKTNAGSVTLSGANTFTGGMTVNAGTLQINTAVAIAQTSEIELNSGGRLTINVKDADLSKLVAGGGVVAGSTLRLAQTQTLGSSPGVISGTLEVSLTNINPGWTLQLGEGGRFTNPAGSTGYTTPISLLGNANIEAQNTTFTISGTVGTDGGSRNLTLTGANNGLLSGLINQGGGTLGLTKAGGGVWDVTNTAGAGNVFSGGIAVTEGTLRFTGNGTTISSGTGTITLDNAGAGHITLSNTAGTISNAIVVAADNPGDGRANISVTGTSAIGFSGPITLNKTLYINGGSTTPVIGGAISGPGGLVISSTLASTGALLTGASAGWSGGVTIESGTLSTGGSQSPDVFGTSDLWLKNGATLAYGVAGQLGFMNHGTIHLDAGTTASLNWTATTNRNQKINDIEIGSGNTGATLNVGLALTSGNGMNVQTGQVRLFGDTTFNVNQAATNTSGRFNVAGGVAEATSLTTSSLIKTGNGLMVLGGSVGAASTTVVGWVNLPSVAGTVSTYKGHTSIWSGTLSLGLNDAMPTTTTAWVAAGAVLDMSHIDSSIRTNSSQQIAGLNDLGGGGGYVIGNSMNLANAVNASVSIGNRTLTLSGTGDYSYSGTITARYGASPLSNNLLTLAKTGSGTQVLDGVAAWNGGTVLQDGVLEIGPGGSAVNTNLTPQGVTITASPYAASQNTITVTNAQAQGVVVGMAVAGSGIAAGATVGTVSGSTVVLSANTTSAQPASNLTFGTLNRATAASVGGLVIGQTITAPGQWATGATIISISGNTLVLSNNNTGAANAFGANFAAWQSLPSSGSVTFSGGTLRWGNGNTSDFSAQFATTGNQQFKLDTGANSVTLASALVSASGSLTKLGSGTLTMAGASTYDGATNLNAGTLRLAANERIADASNINFAGGTLDTGGNEETASDISLSEHSAIDFGAGNSLLAFNTAGTFASGKTITIYNYSGQFLEGDTLVGLTTDQFIIGGQDNILTTQQLAAFIFVDPEGYAGSYSAAQVQGAVVPTFVPEPGMLGFLSLGGMGLLRRRRRNKSAAGV